MPLISWPDHCHNFTADKVHFRRLVTEDHG